MDNLLIKNALDFTARMRANGMANTHATYSSVFEYLNEPVFVLVIHPIGDDLGWNVYWGDYDSTICSDAINYFPVDEHLKEFAFAHIGFCGKCESNKPNYCGKRWTIYGKEFDDVCHAPLVFNEPTADELVKIKKLIEMRIQVINEMKKE